MERKNELDEAMREKVPTSLRLIENILKANKHGKGFLVGDSLTLADLVLIYFYGWLSERKGEVMAELELLREHDEKIRNIPKIAEHLRKNENVRFSKFFSK